MDVKLQAWLHDILDSIEAIESYMPATITIREYQASRMMRKAVEREFETIGECVKKILQFNAQIDIRNGEQIRAFRNRLAHEYDPIADEIIWGIVKKHLPTLKIDVLRLLIINQ